MAVRAALVVAVGEPEQALGVAGLGIDEGFAEIGPVCRLPVERGQHTGEHDRPGRGPLLARLAALDRALVGLFDEVVHDLAWVAERLARCAGQAVGLELVEGVLEALELVGGGGDVVAERVDRAVQDGHPHVVGVQVRVDRAELGAVGEAQVVQRFVAHGAADLLHVLRGLHGVVVGERRPIFRIALGGDQLRQVLRLGQPGGRQHVGRGGVELILLGVADARHRGGQPHPAGVEAQQVEVREQLVRDLDGQADGQLDAGGARPAGVDHQVVAALVVAVVHLEQFDRDRLAGRVVVVERHLQPGAGEREPLGAPRRERQPLEIEQAGAVGEPGRFGCRGRG